MKSITLSNGFLFSNRAKYYNLKELQKFINIDKSSFVDVLIGYYYDHYEKSFVPVLNLHYIRIEKQKNCCICSKVRFLYDYKTKKRTWNHICSLQDIITDDLIKGILDLN